MPARSGATRGPAVLVFLSLVLVSSLLTGCELTVEEPQSGRDDALLSALSTGVVELPDYDVSVSGVDFDPPVRRETLLNAQRPVKLLAAVENKGTMTLTGVVVEARIASQKGEFAASDRTLIDRLSPGETKVVEFEGVAPANSLPRSPSYRITVTAQGQQRDTIPTNNTREIVVRVTD